jgi:SAM-dependent methyltransferase
MLRKVLKRFVPRRLRKFRAVVWAWSDALGRNGVPPAYYRKKVHGSLDIPSYLAVGESCAESILEGLNRIGAEPREFSSILDFGCGVGRTFGALRRHLPQATFTGTDIDATSIRWCRRNLEPGNFDVNSPEPPLSYSSARFDLIYGVSVFSHLDEPLQFRWLQELSRVAKPNAVVLLSVHGPSLCGMLSQAERTEYEHRGFYYTRSDRWSDYFPDFYHTALHTPDYVQLYWSKYLEPVAYIEKGMANYQDLVVLRPRTDLESY